MRGRAVLLLGVLVLIGAPLGWWLLTPRDVTSTTTIDSVRVGSSTRQLSVTYRAGTPRCFAPAGVQVKESPREVRLTARTVHRDVKPFRAYACTLAEVSARSQVALTDPLGDRRVIDTSRAKDGGGVLTVAD